MNRIILNQSIAISGENSVLVLPLGKLGNGPFRWQMFFSILGRLGRGEKRGGFLVGEHAWGGEEEFVSFVRARDLFSPSHSAW